MPVTGDLPQELQPATLTREYLLAGVLAPVPFQVRRRSEARLAQIAPVRFDLQVYVLVLAQLRSRVEALAARETHVRAGLVHQHVVLQLRRTLEAAPVRTHLTGEVPTVGVYVPVTGQAGLAGEPPLAGLALEGFLTGMRAHVALVRVAVGERFHAHLAADRQTRVVDSHVHLQRAATRVPPRAFRALERFHRCCWCCCDYSSASPCRKVNKVLLANATFRSIY